MKQNFKKQQSFTINISLLKILFYIYLLLFIGYVAYNFQQFDYSKSNSNIQQTSTISKNTVDTLRQLVKTKYFRIIRLNLDTQCPIFLMSKICKSNSCSVCRCDQKDIPSVWKKTDTVKSFSNKKGPIDVWQQQRESQNQRESQQLKNQLLKLDKQWVWHVQDQQNDKGQYFDIDTNVESYSGYNGSYIWQLIYQENCFQGRNSLSDMCMEQKTLYKVISGLHTSISTHLSYLYKNISTSKISKWSKPQSDNFFVNRKQYQKRVLNHPQRIENLLFLYEILIHSIRKIQPYLSQNHFIVSDSITQDLKAAQLLQKFIKNIKGQKWSVFQKNQESEIQKFFASNHKKVKQYQKYIHNISRILNCVECQKCRLFGKMQTYGVGTALKILLGYQQPYKRNEIVALFNLLNKISISVSIYFQNRPVIYHDKWFLVKFFTGLCGLLLLFFYMIQKISSYKKINNNLENKFPLHNKQNRNIKKFQ